MISTPEEYNRLLYKIQDKNPPSIAVLIPGSEPIYEIDLDSRIIKGPESLSVELDHKSETLYFRTQRYYDMVDLATTTCVIQYINANGDNRLFVVPFYDITTLKDTNEILFPWLIEGEATKTAGTVKYAIQFYKVDESGNTLTYCLSTLATSGKVLHGISGADEIFEEYNDYDVTAYQELLDRVNRLEGDFDIYWIDL